MLGKRFSNCIAIFLNHFSYTYLLRRGTHKSSCTNGSESLHQSLSGPAHAPLPLAGEQGPAPGRTASPMGQSQHVLIWDTCHFFFSFSLKILLENDNEAHL